MGKLFKVATRARFQASSAYLYRNKELPEIEYSFQRAHLTCHVRVVKPNLEKQQDESYIVHIHICAFDNVIAGISAGISHGWADGSKSEISL